MSRAGPSTSDRGSGSDPDLLLGEVVEEYTARLRAGEEPEVEEFVRRHPGRADEIRGLLSTVRSLEELDVPATTPLFTRLGDFAIERELGRGGMGVVYLATDETLGRRVALKLLPPQATLDRRFLARFKREARAAALLQHPNIVQVHGVGEHEGVHYFAMQYVEGHALDAIVQAMRGDESEEPPSGGSSSATQFARGLLTREISESAPLPPGPAGVPTPDAQTAQPVAVPGLQGGVYDRNVARLGLQVAEALAYAHGRGILHRDIKPANLIVDSRGRAWVTDFGLCRTSDADDLTQTSDLVGTLRYLAPEQVDGRGDVRSDVYALGLTLYELITLRPAFPGKDRAALLRAILETEPPRPRRLRAGIPRDLEAVVLKATAKLPEERYGTAEALAEDLRAFLAGRPVAASPPTALHLLRLAVRRNRLLTAAVGAFVVAVVAAFALYLFGVRRAQAEQERQLYAASVTAAAASAIGGNPAAARRHLELAPKEHRNWEWEHLAVSVDDSLRTIRQGPHPLQNVDVSRDGRRISFAESQGDAFVVDLEADTSWTVDVATGNPIVAVQADGGAIALASRGSLEIFEIGDEVQRVASRGLPTETVSMTFDRGGQRLFVGSRSGRIHAYTPDLARELFVLAGHTSWVSDLVTTDDPDVLVSSSEDGAVRVWDLADGSSRVLTGHDQDVFTVDVSPDGRWIASGGLDGTVRIWDFDSGDPVRILRGHTARVRGLRFSPTDDLLVSCSSDRTLRVWDPHTGRELRTLRGHSGDIVSLRFRRGGTLVSIGENGVVKEWDPRVAGGRVWLDGHIADVWVCAFDASGERLLSVCRDATTRLWDAVTGRPIRVFLGFASPPSACAFHPDGTRIVTGESSGTLRIWDVESAAEISSLSTVGEGVPPVPLDAVTYGRGGDRLFVVARDQAVLRLADEDGQLRIEERRLIPRVRDLDLAQDGRRLVVATGDGRILQLDATTLEPLAESRTAGELGFYPWARFHPGEPVVLAGGYDGLLEVFGFDGAPTGTQLRIETQVVGRGGQLIGFDLTPDSSRLVVGSHATGAQVWDYAGGEPLLVLHGPGRGNSLTSTSPDGRRIAAGSWEGLIRVWDTLSVHQRRARLLEATTREPEARALVDRLIRELGSVARVRTELPTLDLDPALREQALRIAHGISGELDALLARCLGSLRSVENPGAWSEGMALAHGLMKENEEEPRVQRAYGEAYLRHGNPQATTLILEPVAEASLAAGHRDAEAEVLLALAYAALDRWDEARSTLAGAEAAAGPAPAATHLAALLAEARRALAAQDDAREP